METTVKPASPLAGWAGIVLGLLPFVIWLLLMIFIAVISALYRIIPGILDNLESYAPALAGLIFLLELVTLTAIVTAGGLRGWPNWTFSNLGLLVAVSALFQTIALNNGGTVMGMELGASGPWSWIAWIPEVIVVLAILVIRRSLKPFGELIQVLRRDWTLLSFAVYSVVPIAVIVAFDEVRNEIPVIAVMILAITLGALGYLRTPQVPWRFIWLAVFFWFPWAAGAVYIFFYWRGREMYGMPAPANGWDQMFDYLAAGGFILVLLCLPGLIYTLVAVIAGMMRGNGRHSLRPQPPPNLSSN